MHRNEVWEKLSRGHILLSPYTCWVIGLEPIRSNGPSIASLLEELGQNIKHLRINLVGTGVYVDASRVAGAIERQLSLPVALPHQKSNFYLDIASYKIEPFVN